MPWLPTSKERPLPTLNWKRLGLAVPALGACLLWAGFVLLLATWKPSHAETRYEEITTSAFARNDFEAARIACERLLQSASGNPNEHTFKLALCLGNLHRSEESAALLSQLAPLNKPGYPPAHVYLAKALLAQTNLTAQMIKGAETHLLHAVGIEPDLIEAHGLLGEIYLQAGAWAKAKEHLLKVVKKRSEAALSLAIVARAQGDEKGALEWAKQAAKHFSDLVAQDPGDQPMLCIGWADALVLMKDYPAALAVMEVGWKKAANQAYPPAMAKVCAAWLLETKQKAPRDLATRLKLLQQGLQFAPQNTGLLQELIDLSNLAEPEAAAARSKLNELLADTGTFPMLHFLLGSDAWQRGAMNEAREHFAVAFEQAPHIPYIANNLAMVLSIGDKSDFPRALETIQPVVEKFPDNPNFRDTRGRIFLKLGRYHEAVKDLEFALPLLGSKTESHQLLAEAYRHLDLNDLADQHEQLAKAGKPSPSAAKLKADAPK